MKIFKNEIKHEYGIIERWRKRGELSGSDCGNGLVQNRSASVVNLRICTLSDHKNGWHQKNYRNFSFSSKKSLLLNSCKKDQFSKPLSESFVLVTKKLNIILLMQTFARNNYCLKYSFTTAIVLNIFLTKNGCSTPYDKRSSAQIFCVFFFWDARDPYDHKNNISTNPWSLIQKCFQFFFIFLELSCTREQLYEWKLSARRRRQ